MNLSTLERTLAALHEKAPIAREMLRDLAEGESPLGFEIAGASVTLSARLGQTGPAADPDDVEKPWM